MQTPQEILDSTFQVGAIYKFTAPEIIGNDIPHYFVFVGIENPDNYMVICTTQLHNKIKQFKRMNYAIETLARIHPNAGNGLTDDTYVNCNEYHPINKSQLLAKIGSSKFEVTGTLTKEEFEAIKTSINLSYTNDLPKYLIVHPDE